MNDIIDIKEEFYKQLNQYLTTCGFSKNDNQWMRITHEKTPGQRMIINGQVMESAGTNIDINIVITNKGVILTGSIEDPKDVWNGPEMAQINLLRKHNDDEILNIDLCVPFDDFKYIKVNIEQIL